MNISSVSLLILLVFNSSMSFVATIRACCCFKKNNRTEKLINLNEPRMPLLQNGVTSQACARVPMDWVGKQRESIVEKHKLLVAKK